LVGARSSIWRTRSALIPSREPIAFSFSAGRSKPKRESMMSRSRAVSWPNDRSLIAKLPPNPQLEAGEERDFSVPLRDIRIFDAETERSPGPVDAPA
jgi:hypothetical protein